MQNKLMSQSDKKDTLKKAMLKALETSLAVVTTASALADVSRATHYRWMQEDKDYADAVNDLQEVALDFAESALQKQIAKGDTTAIIFYLKTKGKKRGYIERQELTGAEGGPLNIQSTIIVHNTGYGITEDSEANVLS
jgi:hypothetical protein